MSEDLDKLVRRADEDRWLASRFALAPVRARLVATYAVCREISRSREIMKEPALGAIRLAWWREEVRTVCAGGGQGAHPALSALAMACGETTPPWALWAPFIDVNAMAADTAPSSPAQTQAGAAAAVMRLAVWACDAATDAGAFISAAAPAWGLASTMIARPPPRPLDAATLAQARATYQQARALSPLPGGVFPALGYVALLPAYFRALETGRTRPPLLARQLRLIGAAASGRI